MSNPVASVSDGGDPYSGGTLARAGRPTAASGGFNFPGSFGFPTPGVPGILTARNNRGTNTLVPYPRVVPLHGKDQLMVTLPGRAGPPGHREPQFEYDGLEAGELAWVLSKQFAMLRAASPPIPATSLSWCVLAAGHEHRIHSALCIRRRRVEGRASARGRER